MFNSRQQVDEYINHDEIECLECGSRFQFLPAHINRAHGLTAANYRKKYNLPAGTPLAGLAYRLAHKQKMRDLIDSGILTYEHLPDAVNAAQDAGRGQRTNYDLADQSQRAKNIPRQSQLPPGARLASGRDADRAREYQHAFRALKNGNESLMNAYKEKYR